AAARAAGTVVATVLRRRLALGRAMLSDLIASLLPLLRRHLAPALHVLLESLALVGAHALVALEPLAKKLLLLLREPLEALVGRIQLALPLRRERLETPEIVLQAGASARGHGGPGLVGLARRRAVPGGGGLPPAVV